MLFIYNCQDVMLENNKEMEGLLNSTLQNQAQYLETELIIKLQKVIVEIS